MKSKPAGGHGPRLAPFGSDDRGQIGSASAGRYRTASRNGVFTSVPQLERATHDYLAEHNENPKPFAWTADADAILERLKRVCERTSDSGHW
jgi:hypothetical protein